MKPVLLICASLTTIASGCSVGSDTCVASPVFRDVGEGCSSGECSSGTCIDGVCVATGGIYQPCGTGCVEDLVCTDGVCRGMRSLAAGERCEWLTTPEPCVDGYWCAHPEFGVTGNCTPQVGSGEACTDDLACVFGLVCADGSCGDLPVAGEHCSAGYRCADGFFCAEDGSCWGPPLAEGDRCRPHEWGCPPGLYCDLITAVCVPGRAEGESCASDREDPECSDGLYCNPTRSRCERPFAPDEACEYGDRCSDGTVCQLVDVASGARRCGTPVERGGFCGDGQVCGAGTYCDYRQELEFNPDGCFYAPCP